MTKEADPDLKKRVLAVVMNAPEPLETKEVGERLSGVSRIQVIYQLRELRGDGKIRGKMVGSGKGVWIWYI